jgi:tetratricopeptide (TPR) repeat protein
MDTMLIHAPPLQELLPLVFAAYNSRDFEKTARMAEIVTRHYPKSADAWMLLCTALARMGSVDEEKAIERALEHIPHHDPAYLILEVDHTHALSKVGRMYDAVTRLRRLENRNLSAKQRDTLGVVFAQAGLFDDALRHCAATMRDSPDYVPGIYNYATTLRYLGRLDEAEEAFERALALAPQHYLSHASLAVTKRWTRENNHIDRLKRELDQVTRGGTDEAHLRYALFKELHDINAPPDIAWAELTAGSEICHRLYEFKAAEQAATAEATIKAYSKDQLTPRSVHKPEAPRPIFIVGLPRSGTTLTERILAAHSSVTPLGETAGFPRAMVDGLKLAGRREDLDPDSIMRSLKLDWAAIAQTYQRETSFLARGAKYVTEKLPPNYKLVGQISLAFPSAPIIHVRRNPMDSLFGTYKLMFGQDSYAWSYRQEDLAANYRLYRMYMRHWSNALGSRLHVVTLENLIASAEHEIRALLHFCGLPFEAACLEPHKAEGGVSTASASQIRNPINSEGIGAWRRYAEQLEPLRAELERDGFVDRSGDPIWE